MVHAYLLQRLEPATFQASIKEGKIHPEMTQADAEALLPPKKRAPVVPLSDAVLREGSRMIAEYVAGSVVLFGPTVADE